MADAASAARGVYTPRRPEASPLFRLVSDHLHRLQTVYDERFASYHLAVALPILSEEHRGGRSCRQC